MGQLLTSSLLKDDRNSGIGLGPVEPIFPLFWPCHYAERVVFCCCLFVAGMHQAPHHMQVDGNVTTPLKFAQVSLPAVLPSPLDSL